MHELVWSSTSILVLIKCDCVKNTVWMLFLMSLQNAIDIFVNVIRTLNLRNNDETTLWISSTKELTAAAISTIAFPAISASS